MAQAKVLYVVMAAGRLRMSELAARLGIGSSSASELVDRLVELGPARRGAPMPTTAARSSSPPRPRRTALLERFRELNQRQLRELLARLDAARARHRRRVHRDPRLAPSTAPPRPDSAPSPHPHDHPAPDTRGDTPVSRLSRLALSKRSVTLLFAGALFIAGISAWGSLKQELLPDIDFPVITVVTPYPGAGSSDVTEQVTKPIENAISGVPRLETDPVDLVELDLAGRRPVLVRDRRQGDDPGDPGGDRQGEPARHRRRRPSRRSTSTPRRWSSRRSPRRVTTASTRSAQIARTEIVPEIQGDRRRRPRRPDRRPRGAGLHHPRPGQDGRGEHHQPADRRRPPGQQPDPPVRPAARRRLEGPGLDHR